jgi:hypothetical protein
VAAFMGGMFEGTAETLKFHYYRFEKRFPKANDNYWDPVKSWENKYKNNEYGQGAKYLGSTTFLAWTTDGYHMTRTVRNGFLMTAIVLKKNKRQKWYWYVVEGFGHLVAYQAGFHASYSLLFRK